MTSSEPYNPFHENDVTEREKESRAHVTPRQHDIRWVLSDARGRRVLKRLLAQTRHDGLSFVMGDPLATAFNEGKRAIGLHLCAVLTQAGQDGLTRVLTEEIETHVRRADTGNRQSGSNRD